MHIASCSDAWTDTVLSSTKDNIHIFQFHCSAIIIVPYATHIIKYCVTIMELLYFVFFNVALVPWIHIFQCPRSHGRFLQQDSLKQLVSSSSTRFSIRLISICELHFHFGILLVGIRSISPTHYNLQNLHLPSLARKSSAVYPSIFLAPLQGSTFYSRFRINHRQEQYFVHSQFIASLDQNRFQYEQDCVKGIVFTVMICHSVLCFSLQSFSFH